MLPKDWQAWGIKHPSRKPPPVLDHLSKEMLPNFKTKLPQAQFEPFQCVLLLDPKKQSSAPPSNTSFPQESEGRTTRLFLEFFFHKLDKSKALSCSSQDVFHPLHWFCLHPPLDALEHLNIVFIWWGPELHTGPKVEAASTFTTAGQSPFLFDYAVFDAPRMGIALWVARALSAGSHWAAVNHHPQIPFCRSSTPP